MTSNTIQRFNLATALFIDLFAPRPIRRMALANIFLAVGFFVTLKPGVDVNVDGGESLSFMDRWTLLSWLFLIAYVCLWVFGWPHVRGKMRQYRLTGTPPKEASFYQAFTGRDPYGPRYIEEPAEQPVTEAPSSPVRQRQQLVVPTVIASGKARSIEEHDGFDQVDRRRFAHLVDEYYTG